MLFKQWIIFVCFLCSKKDNGTFSSISQYQYQFILVPAPRKKNNNFHFTYERNANKIKHGTKGDHERARRSPDHGDLFHLVL